MKKIGFTSKTLLEADLIHALCSSFNDCEAL